MENMVATPAFWKDKKVFITGHTGFKGGWLSLWLQQLGAKPIGLALPPPSTPNLFQLASVADNMTSIIGDIRNIETISSALKKHQPEIVIHMAAQPLVRQSYLSPVDTYSTNVMGTVNLLETVRGTDSVRVVINVTSDKCYEHTESPRSHSETDPMGGHDPYSSSKGCAELVTTAFRKSFFFNPSPAGNSVALASVRAGNVIGGGDWGQDRLVPDVMRAFMTHHPATIRYPGAIRPWQHVLEPLSGYLRLVEEMWNDPVSYCEGWNFGPDEEDAKPVSWVVSYLARLWGTDAKWTPVAGDHPHETHCLKLDSSKARSRLSWKPRLRLPEALEWTINWYKAYQQNDSMQAVTMDQLSRFQKI